MMRGILYSPVSGSLSVNIAMVSEVFMAGFQLMLDMNKKSVSIL